MVKSNDKQIDAYQALSGALKQVGSVSSASECHGILCGQLCRGQNLSGMGWLQDLLGTADPDGEDAVGLATIMAEQLRSINGQLTGGDLGFRLLLGDEDEMAAVRALSLTQWCEGFLFGFALGGEFDKNSVVDEVQEALQDIRDITRMDLSQQDYSEEDEAALVEIEEYVRVGAMLVFEEIRHVSNQKVSPAVENDTIH